MCVLVVCGLESKTTRMGGVLQTGRDHVQSCYLPRLDRHEVSSGQLSLQDNYSKTMQNPCNISPGSDSLDLKESFGVG